MANEWYYCYPNGNREVHYLDNYYNESPLDGRIVMKIQLTMPPKVTHCGMLRLKDSTGMFGSVDFIKSFFGAIEGGRLNLWNDMRDAEDEQVSTQVSIADAGAFSSL